MLSSVGSVRRGICAAPDSVRLVDTSEVNPSERLGALNKNRLDESGDGGAERQVLI